MGSQKTNTMNTITPVHEDRDLTELDVWSRHCLAGGFSAAVSKTVSAPLDRIKMSLQVTDSGSVREALRRVYGQGVRGFWRGNGLNVLKSSPEFAIKFSVYDYVKRVLKSVKDDGHVGSYDRFMAGAVAGVCSQSSMYPLEILKTRLMASKREGEEMASATKVIANMYNRGGMSAFFKGFLPSSCGIFLFTGIDLMTYEYIKHWLLQYQSTARMTDPQGLVTAASPWTQNLLSALISSSVGNVVAYPLSMLTTRIQADEELPGRTIVQEYRRCVAMNGYRGLYRGFGCGIVKMLPSMSISYVVYEELCRSLDVQMTS